jgi:colanic acid biosynthesis glycosyl transferase WcaI
LVMWVMDLYPDAAIAAGWMRKNAPITKALTRLFAYSLRTATEIVVLDTFMAARLREKNIPPHKLVIVPPWSHDEDVRYDSAGRAAFRERYGLTDKVVVMYAGNHNACHPLDTLLQAALALRTNNDIVFCFVGGGVRFGEVRRFVSEHRLTNVVSIPYQPLELLSAALSSADLHVVVMGNGLAGIVHPCKAYNILRLGIPFLYIGPTESHVTELVPPHAIGDWAYLTGHGDVQAVVNAIVNCSRIGGRLSEAERNVGRQFSGATLLPLLTGLFEPVSGTVRETSPSPAAAEAARCDAGGEPA